MQRSLCWVALALVLAWLVGASQPYTAQADGPTPDQVQTARLALDRAIERHKLDPTDTASRALREAQAEYGRVAAARRAVLEERLLTIEQSVSDRPQRFGVQPSRLPREIDAAYTRLLAELAALAHPATTTDGHPTYRPEIEPNPTTVQATPLIFSSPLTAVAYGSIRQGDVDTYSFTAPANARVFAYVDTGGSRNPGATYMDSVLTLLDGAGAPLEEDMGDGAATGCDRDVELGLASVIAGRLLPAGGTYYLRVRAFSPTLGISPYKLFVLVTPSTASEVEPNNTSGQATALSNGGRMSGAISSPGDTDLYALPAARGNILFISLDGDPERDATGTDTEIELLGIDGLTVLITVDQSGANGAPAPPAEGFCYLVSQPGTYYLRVRHVSGGTGSYALAAVAKTGAVAPFTAQPALARGATRLFRASLSGDALDFSFTYGLATDIARMCDWDGNGTRTPGNVRGISWRLRNSHTPGDHDTIFDYGAPGDVPVCGDWNGDGIDTPGVFRNGAWFLRNANSSGPATFAFSYGLPGDTPIVGDWDGDGDDSIGIVRSGVWYLRDVPTSGNADYVYAYGLASDLPIPGDWNGDGSDTPGVFRDGTWFLRNGQSGGTADIVFGFGQVGDRPLTWK